MKSVARVFIIYTCTASQSTVDAVLDGVSSKNRNRLQLTHSKCVDWTWLELSLTRNCVIAQTPCNLVPVRLHSHTWEVRVPCLFICLQFLPQLTILPLSVIPLAPLSKHVSSFGSQENKVYGLQAFHVAAPTVFIHFIGTSDHFKDLIFVLRSMNTENVHASNSTCFVGIMRVIKLFTVLLFSIHSLTLDNWYDRLCHLNAYNTQESDNKN